MEVCLSRATYPALVIPVVPPPDTPALEDATYPSVVLDDGLLRQLHMRYFVQKHGILWSLPMLQHRTIYSHIITGLPCTPHLTGICHLQSVPPVSSL